MDKDDLRLLITDVLIRLQMYSSSATELLMGTCAVESDFCKYTKQLGGGPGLGWWQVEPNTMHDIWNNYIRYRQSLQSVLWSEFSMSGPDLKRLKDDPEYSIVIARLKYRRSVLPLPSANNVYGLAKIWKEVYNTAKGRGEVEDFVNKYTKYCR